MTKATITEVISPYISDNGQSNLQKPVLGGLEFKNIMNQEVHKGLNKSTDEIINEVNKEKESYKSPAISDKDPDRANVDSMKSTEETANTSKLDKKEDIHNLEEVQDSLEDFSLKLKKMLLESFGVTEEELIKAMENLGIGYLDLVDLENLSKLALSLTGSEDMISLIANEEVCMEYMNLLEGITELVTDVSSGLGLTPEEMTKLIDILKAQEESASTQENSDFVLEAIPETENAGILEADKGILVNENSVALKEEADSKTKVMDSVKDTSGIEDGEEAVKQNLKVQAEREGSFEENRESGLHNSNNLSDNIVGQANFQNTLIQSEEYTAEMINTEDIIRQIVDEVKITVSANITNMELQLNPENLGKVTINISSKEEMVTAQIIAGNHTVKEALEAQIASLRENLNSQGVKVDAIEVTVESHAFESNLEQNNNTHSNQSEEAVRQGRRQINISTLEEDLSDFTEADTLTADMMIQNGNSVDYMA